jgi:hypothetical protein
MEKTKKIKQMKDDMKAMYAKQGAKTYGDSSKTSPKVFSRREQKSTLNQW